MFHVINKVNHAIWVGDDIEADHTSKVSLQPFGNKTFADVLFNFDFVL